MNINLIVCTHKPYEMPADPMYVPVFVGAKGKTVPEGYLRDDTGENISSKNPYYCELTGLYWAWKNLNTEYLGLAHYRRHFLSPKAKENGIEEPLTKAEAEQILKTTDIILPKKRNYYIESVYSHYDHTHYGEDLDKTRDVIKKYYPNYLEAFDKVMKSRSVHICNMFIMKKELADKYSEFLFDVLEKLESKIDHESYNPFQARVYGRISELLLDVWIDANHLTYKEVPAYSLEKTDWIKKGGSFLRAKFLNEKYTGSF